MIYGRGAICQALLQMLRTGTVPDGAADGSGNNTIQTTYESEVETHFHSTCPFPTSPRLLKSQTLTHELVSSLGLF